MRTRRIYLGATILALGSLVPCGLVDESKGGEPQIIARGLDNPCGIAVQPGTNHVFVSTRAGVFRLVPAAAGFASHAEIVGFPTDIYGRGPAYKIGPLGLAFLDSKTLIVGGGELPDGEELVRFYTVRTEPRATGQAQKVEEMKASSGPFPAGDDSLRGEGNFFGVAVKGTTVFVTANGDDTKGWIFKIEVAAGKPGPLVPFIRSKEETGVDGPTGATISPDGKLVVCQFGEVNLPGDGLLTIYDPDSGALEAKQKTGLNDPAGVAYSPKTGKLYMIDFSWAVPGKGGLFLLEQGGAKMKATRIAQLNHPSALAFAPDGTLFVAVIGIREDSDASKAHQPGSVLVFKDL